MTLLYPHVPPFPSYYPRCSFMLRFIIQLFRSFFIARPPPYSHCTRPLYLSSPSGLKGHSIAHLCPPSPNAFTFSLHSIQLSSSGTCSFHHTHSHPQYISPLSSSGIQRSEDAHTRKDRPHLHSQVPSYLDPYELQDAVDLHTFDSSRHQRLPLLDQGNSDSNRSTDRPHTIHQVNSWPYLDPPTQLHPSHIDQG